MRIKAKIGIIRRDTVKENNRHQKIKRKREESTIREMDRSKENEKMKSE
jgi:hypothetical protein